MAFERDESKVGIAVLTGGVLPLVACVEKDCGGTVGFCVGTGGGRIAGRVRCGIEGLTGWF